MEAHVTREAEQRNGRLVAEIVEHARQAAQKSAAAEEA
jgi:hypothetical protein